MGADIVAHMNADHADAIAAYAVAFAGVADPRGARMHGIDTRGMTLAVPHGDGERLVRIEFAEPVTTPGRARRILVEMAAAARQRLAR